MEEFTKTAQCLIIENGNCGKEISCFVHLITCIHCVLFLFCFVLHLEVSMHVYPLWLVPKSHLCHVQNAIKRSRYLLGRPNVW